MEGWKGKILSMAGRAELIRSVINPMLLHSFHVYAWPKMLLDKVQRWIRNFLWSGDILLQKLVTVSWSIVSSSKESGGLGIRHIHSINKAALLKSMWEVLHSNSAWSKLVISKYDIKQTKASHTYKISSIWPGLRRALTDIDLHSRWIIGNGFKVNIWENVWLQSELIPKNNANLSHRSSVDSLIEEKKWKIPPWFRHQYPYLINSIQQITLPEENRSDILIWPYSKKGNISFKDAFNHYHPSATVQWTKHLWKPFISPRISTLYWKIMHNKLPTQENLQKRGMIFVPRCEICKKNTDSIHHVFIECPLATQLWRWIWFVFKISSPHPNYVSSLWECIGNQNLSKQVFNLWVGACQVALYSIWGIRNNVIFRAAKPLVAATLNYIKCWLQDLAAIVPGHMNNCIEDLSILNSIGVTGVPPSCPKIIEVIWTPPHFSWHKANTDGLAFGSPGRAAIGGIFRNYRGFSKGAFSKFIGIHNAFEAELLAFMQAIEIAWEKNWRKLWVEMDSKAVVNCVMDHQFKPPWCVLTQWANCKAKMSQMQLHITHIYREGNQVADYLSKMGIHFNLLQWWPSFPPRIGHLLGHDYASMPSYRFNN